MQPFLKWPGGKRWLLQQYKEYFPKDYNRYYEPFLGGGAAFFHLQPAVAVLSDINGDLISLYTVMRDSPEELAKLLRLHESQHCSEYYYKIRDMEYQDTLKKQPVFSI